MLKTPWSYEAIETVRIEQREPVMSSKGVIGAEGEHEGAAREHVSKSLLDAGIYSVTLGCGVWFLDSNTS